MYIPKVHAFSSSKGEAILARAHKAMVQQRKSLESPPEDGYPTADQMEEVRYVVIRELMGEYRASFEMDMFEEIDNYCVIEGTPSTAAEIEAFWREVGPKVVAPVVVAIADAHGVTVTAESFAPEKFTPWTESGLRDMTIHLANRLATAQVEALDDPSFILATELDASQIALIGSTEWVGTEPKEEPAGGAFPPPPPPSAAAALEALAISPPGPGKPKKDAEPPKAAPDGAVPRDGRVIAAKESKRGLTSEICIEIWTLFGEGHNFEIGTFAREAGISTATYRNYLAGKKSRLDNNQAALIRKDTEERLACLNKLNEIMKSVGL